MLIHQVSYAALLILRLFNKTGAGTLHILEIEKALTGTNVTSHDIVHGLSLLYIIEAIKHSDGNITVKEITDDQLTALSKCIVNASGPSNKINHDHMKGTSS